MPASAACRWTSSVPSSWGGNAELARLRAALARTAAGDAGVVLVGGEAGVGKSRLLEAAFGTGRRGPGAHRRLHRARRRGPAARPAGRGAAHAGPDDAGRRPGPAARPGPPRAGPAAAGAGPGERRSPADGAGSTAQLFELVLGVLGRLGAGAAAGARRRGPALGRPLHPGPARLPGPRAAGHPGAARAHLPLRRGRPPQPLRPLLVGLGAAARRRARRSCERFNRAEVAAQIGAILGAAPDGGDGRPRLRPVRGQRLLRRGAASRTVRDGAAENELPPSLRDVLLVPRRAAVRARPAAAAHRRRRRPLGARAAAGRGRRGVAGRAVRGPARGGGRVAAASSTAPAAATPSGTRSTRDAVYEDLLPGERVELHTAYAEALDRDPGLAGDDASVAATLAVHWYAAHDMPRALAASVRAGAAGHGRVRAGRGRGSTWSARWRCGAACRTPRRWAGADQVEVLRLLRARDLPRRRTRSGPSRCCGRPCDLVDARRRPRTRRPRGRAAVHHVARPRRDGGQLEELEEALARLPEEPPTLARAALLVVAGEHADAHAAPTDLRVGRTALAAAPGGRGEAAGGQLAHHAGFLAELPGRPGGGRALPARGSAAGPRTTEDHETALRGYVNLSDSLEARDCTGTPPTRLRRASTSRAASDCTRNFGAYLVGNLVEPLVRLGDWARGRRELAEGVAGHRPDRHLPGVGGGTARLHGGQGRPARRRPAARPLGRAPAGREPRAAVHPGAAVHRGGGRRAPAATWRRPPRSSSTGWRRARPGGPATPGR